MKLLTVKRREPAALAMRPHLHVHRHRAVLSPLDSVYSPPRLKGRREGQMSYSKGILLPPAPSTIRGQGVKLATDP